MSLSKELYLIQLLKDFSDNKKKISQKNDQYFKNRIPHVADVPVPIIVFGDEHVQLLVPLFQVNPV